MELSSEYQMWARGKQGTRVLDTFENPDATSSGAAVVERRTTYVGAKSDIDKYGAQAMIPLASLTCQILL